MRTLLGCFAVLIVVGFAAGATPDKARADVNCSDFSNQAQAQSFFLAHGGPGSDPYGLDADHDGVACESLPCPCSSTGTGAPPPPIPNVQTITCWGKAKLKHHGRVVVFRRFVLAAPSYCSLLGPRVSAATGAVLVGMQWTNWGQPSVTGTGYSLVLGARGPGFPAQLPATVTLSNLVPSSSGYWYSAMSKTVTLPDGTTYTGSYRLKPPNARRVEKFKF